MSDEIDYPDDEPVTVGLADRRVLMLVLLGGAALAVTLGLLVRVRNARPSATLGQPWELDPNATWQAALKASIEHLAAAFDLRLAGIDARLDELAGETVAGYAASYSAPVVGLVESNGDTVDRNFPPIHVGAEEPPPPQPAAVSMPPE